MSWQSVAKTADVPVGGSHVIRVNGRELALFNLRGEVYCIDNLCPHAMGPLADGWIEGDIVICPWHGWEFNIKTGDAAYGNEACVQTFPCRIDGDEILIDF